MNHNCFERLKFCSGASCDHKKEFQVLLQVVQDGGGTRIAGYVHWNDQKYLEVAKTVEVEATALALYLTTPIVAVGT